jgi:hypothetical protein
MKLEKSFDLCRKAEEYEASTHLIQRMRERPLLEADVVIDIIEDGDIVDVDSNEGGSDRCVTLRGDWCLSTFEVKLCPKDRVVQTAYEVEE